MNDWLRIAIACLSPVVALIMIWQKCKTREIALVIGSMAASAFIIDLPLVQVFKFAGVYAEMRQTVDKAGVTVVQLRALAVTLARESLLSTVYMDEQRFHLRHAIATRSAIIQNLQELGASSADMKQATSDFDHVIELRLAEAVQNAVNNYAAPHVDFSHPPTFPVDHSLYDKTRPVEASLFHRLSGQVSTAADMETALSKVFILPQTVQDAIKDLEAYQQDGTIRRPDVFYVNEPS